MAAGKGKGRKAKEHIPAKEKLAAALLMCMKPDGNGGWERVIPHHEAVMMTADQIISLFQWHHDPIAEADGGKAVAWNLTPTFIIPHRKISARQRTEAAKSRRIRAAQAEHVTRLAARSGQTPQAELRETVRPKPKAVMPGAKASKWKRKMSGRVELRT